MALAHTPLDPSRLSPNARRALAPGPARMMAARGLAPLPRPGDLITVLYQLAIDGDTSIREAAQKSARELPERVLSGGLADETVDPRVIDYFTETSVDSAALLQLIVLNRATADETIASLAARASAELVDLIAQNEQRILRHPAIIGSMFHNRRARMSTVDRAIELAARNQVKVPNIPSWDALASAVLGQGKDPGRSPAENDAVFEQATRAMDAQDEARAAAKKSARKPADSDAQEEGSSGRTAMPQISQMTIPMKIRLATLGNSFARAQLIRDPNRLVASAAIKAPGVTDSEAAKYASNSSLPDEVIKHIAGRRDWTKNYGIKLALIQNPKTPIPDAIRFMPHLREKDLRSIARSRGIPSAVVAQARKLIMQRRGPGKKK